MARDGGYTQRLAELDARTGRARLDPQIALERAAGLLAGRVGCQVDEAHRHLRQLADEQGRDVRLVAAEVLAALQARTTGSARRLRSAVDEALQAPPWPPSPAPPSPTPAAPLVGPAAGGREPGGGEHYWAAVVRQVLGQAQGEHLAVAPLVAADGTVSDYLIVAASPAVVDLSGRRGAQLVGRRVTELYPAMVGGPVWRLWQRTLTDGVPGEVGPFPYVGGPADGPVSTELTVRAHPVASGLLISWVRHDEETRLAERIAQTERLGGLGWAEWDLVTGAIQWSDELYRIYERDPALGPMPRAETDALAVPEDEPVRRQARESFGRGETADVILRIRVGGRIKHVRTVVDAVRDVNGRPLKVYGIVQDVTARETSRAKLAEVERQLREHQLSLAAEHHLAAQLQHIVLPIPAVPIDLPGLRVAIRYLPAEQASRVGGDWFHAAATRDGDVLLAIGDVAGHGIHAATTMAQLRHALAALTITTTTDPGTLMSHLNQLLYAPGATAGTATAIIARYSPTTGEIRWAQAGHPAPLCSRAGTTRELDRPTGPLLGAIRTAVYPAAVTSIDADDVLLLYTDGLIEHREHSLAEGLRPVIATLDEITGERRQQPLSDLLARLRRANPDDDTCILAARRMPFAGNPGDRPGPPAA